jgi:hypothetical protein
MPSSTKMPFAPEAGCTPSRPSSKRAARRLIQRAFVLLGRDKRVRQHLREAHLTTLWIIQDWELAWTVVLERGRLKFERRPAKQADLSLTWRTAADFFGQVEARVPAEGLLELEGSQESRRFCGPVLNGFLCSLRHVLSNPVDDKGESLV